MIDLQLLRTQLDVVSARLATRGKYVFPREEFLALDAEYRNAETRLQELQAKKNSLAKQIGQAKAKGSDSASLVLESNKLNEQLSELEGRRETARTRFSGFHEQIPNVPHESVPAGVSSEDNVEQRRWGEPRRFDFPVKDHVDVGAGLGQLDFDTATKLAGARFAVMRGGVARLHRAIAQFMLDVHTQEHGYTEVYVPYMVTGECANGVSSLAKFKDDLFKIEGRDL